MREKVALDKLPSGKKWRKAPKARCPQQVPAIPQAYHGGAARLRHKRSLSSAENFKTTAAPGERGLRVTWRPSEGEWSSSTLLCAAMGVPRRIQSGEEAGHWLRDASCFPRPSATHGDRRAWAGLGPSEPRSVLRSLPSRSRPLRGEDRDLPAVLPAGRLHGGRGRALAHQLHRGLRVPLHPGEWGPLLGAPGAALPHSLFSPPAAGPQGRGAPGNKHQFPSTKDICSVDGAEGRLAGTWEVRRTHGCYRGQALNVPFSHH